MAETQADQQVRRKGSPLSLHLPSLPLVAAWIARHDLWLLAATVVFVLASRHGIPLILALIALIWCCRRIASGRFTLRTAMDVPTAVLVAMALLNTAISVDPAISQARFGIIALEVALYYHMVNELRSHRDILRITGVLILVIAGVGLASLVRTEWAIVRLVDLPQVYGRLPRLAWNEAGGGMPWADTPFNPREVGATQAILLPVSMAFLLFGRHRGLRWLSLGGFAVGGMIVLLSQSLESMLGLAVGLLLIITWRSRWFLVSVPIGLLAIAAAVLAYGPGQLALTLLSLKDRIGIGVVLRLDIWSRGLAMIHDMPYTGIGLNTYAPIQTHFYPGFLLGPEPHAHSLFLQTALDFGLPGLVAFLWLLAAFYFTVVRAYRATSNRDLRALLVGLAGGVLVYLVNGLVDMITIGAVSVWAMLGLAAAVAAQATTDNTEPATVVNRHTLAILVVASFALLASFFIVPAAPYLNLGAIRAHKVLLEARTAGSPQPGALQAAAEPLRQALARDPDNAHAYDLLGSLYAWQGDYAAALQAFDHGVALDGQSPMAHYGPFEALRRRMAGEPVDQGWDDLLWVYGYWMARYPDRAETYVKVAMVWDRHKGDRARAAAVLRSGLDRGAQPRGLLSYYRLQLK